MKEKIKNIKIDYERVDLSDLTEEEIDELDGNYDNYVIEDEEYKKLSKKNFLKTVKKFKNDNDSEDVDYDWDEGWIFVRWIKDI